VTAGKLIKSFSYIHNTKLIGSYQNEVIFGKQMIRDDIPPQFSLPTDILIRLFALLLLLWNSHVSLSTSVKICKQMSVSHYVNKEVTLNIRKEARGL
jgi:hypothetical protein